MSSPRKDTSRYEDLVARIYSLSSIEELSLLLQPHDATGVLAMMIVAYGDESEDKHSFGVSALLGELPEWVELERLWRAQLEKEQLPEFHAADCENAAVGSPFEFLFREIRDRLQREFYGLINKVRLSGFCTVVWQSAYKARWSEFQGFRSGSEGDFTHPYFLAFQHCVESMSLAMNKGGFPASEPIAFVFDQQKELEGRAKVLYDSLKYSPGSKITYARRLGSLSFDSRFCQIQLQAADSWAYESRKWASDVLIRKIPDGERWQFKLLNETGRHQISGFPDEKLDELIAFLRNQPVRTERRA